jgi:energy-coupling factor transporter ATP-binding protein EcfA2
MRAYRVRVYGKPRKTIDAHQLAQALLMLARELQRRARRARRHRTETTSPRMWQALMMRDVAVLMLAMGAGLAGLVLVAFGVRVLVHEVQMAAWRRSLVALELRVPRTATVKDVARWVGTARAMVRSRRWWSLLPRWPLVMETTATKAGVRWVLLVPDRLRAQVISTVAATVPGARLEERPEYLSEAMPRFQAAAEVRLRGGGFLLATGRAEDTSRHVLAALQPLEDGEVVRVQWLFTGAKAPGWITSPATKDTDVPALWRSDDPMLCAVCRVAVGSRFGTERARGVFGRVWAALRGMNTPRTWVARRWWRPRFVVAAILRERRVPRGRWPIVVTAAELAGLLGVASGTAALPGVVGGVSRMLPTPPTMPVRGLPVARGNYPGTGKDITLSVSDRLRHVWVCGPTGVGKTTLLANMALHDIAAGNGVVVVDASSSLISTILDRIPEDRAEDVIVVDPAQTDFPVGLNPLAAGDPEQAAAFVYHAMYSIYATSWGPRTADLLRAGLLTLALTRASNGERFTILEMPELLTNAGFRRTVTAQSLPPHLGSFWRWFESLSEPARLNAVSPVLNKLRAFTLSTPLRLMLGQSSGLDFAEAIASKKIGLVPLRKGLLGAENAALVGSLIIASVWQAALTRASVPEAKRRPFWLLIDEFQDTVRLPIDVGDMLAQARSLGLGLTLAHQFLRQLDRQMQSSILGTAHTHIVFQLGVEDADTLARSFTPLTVDDLRYLGAFEVAVRPCVGGATLTPVTGTTYPAPDPVREGDALAEESRQRYGAPRADVETHAVDRLSVPVGKHANRLVLGEQ